LSLLEFRLNSKDCGANGLKIGGCDIFEFIYDDIGFKSDTAGDILDDGFNGTG
jgi:hypothetical protein